MNHFALFNIRKPFDTEFESSVYYNTNGLDLFILNYKEIVALIEGRLGTRELVENWLAFFEHQRQQHQVLSLTDICIGAVWKSLACQLDRSEMRGDRILKGVLDRPFKFGKEICTLRKDEMVAGWFIEYYRKHYHVGIQYMGVEEHPRTSLEGVFWDGTIHCARCGKRNPVAWEEGEEPLRVLAVRSPLCGHPHFSWLFHCSVVCHEETEAKAMYDWDLYRKIHKDCCADYCSTFILGDCIEIYRENSS